MNISRTAATVIAAIIMVTALVSCSHKHNDGPQMTVIVSEDGTVGRYLGEDASSYRGEIQDEYMVSKDKAHTEVLKASDGQGILTLKEPGHEPVYARPSAKSEVIGTMVHEEGFVPEVYRCLGYSKGWFRVEVDGKTGYVPEASVRWDSVDSF